MEHATGSTQVTVPGLGTVALGWTTDYTSATSVYEVTASRVSGVVRLTPVQKFPNGPVVIDTPHVLVLFGRSPSTTPDGRVAERLRVNGVELVGVEFVDSGLIALRTGGEQVPALRSRGRDWSLYRSTGPYTSAPVSQATAERAGQAIEAVLVHWLERPDRRRLLVGAARRDAAERLRELRAVIEERNAEIAKMQAEVTTLKEECRDLEAVVATPVPGDGAGEAVACAG